MGILRPLTRRDILESCMGISETCRDISDLYPCHHAANQNTVFLLQL